MGALPTGETNQNCIPLFSVEMHRPEEQELVQWPQHSEDKRGSEIFLPVAWGKLVRSFPWWEGETSVDHSRLLGVLTSPTTEWCPTSRLRNIVVVIAALSEEN